ncbi:hypothetical protein GH714_031815 [Hevea brasiliensis]|uniref:Uncharacterized protein n=1 Tax=Hevea brasiliensis TaxID=3981 RepID=A0A6A6LD94_HEVBR|nr:hypothetical protein GH714_031815 [Hevea brasiliensis]
MFSAMEVQVVKREADQASGSYDEINIVEDEASGSLVQPCTGTGKLSIRVPYMLRENKGLEKYYKPRVVAIGPIHRDNPNLEYGERMKSILAGQFMKENMIDAEDLYNMIMADLEKLKMYYVKM